MVKVPLHSTGAASRLTALLLGHILPVFSLVAPCQTGASPVSVRRGTFTTDCSLGAAAIVTMLGLGGALIFNPFILPRYDDLQMFWPFGLLGVFLGAGLALNYYLTRPSS